MEIQSEPSSATNTLGKGHLSRALVQTLADKQSLLDILTQSIPDLIYVKDTECRYVFNNAAHVAFLGAKSPEEVLGKTVLDYFPREIAESFYQAEKTIMKTGVASRDHVEKTVDARGRPLWVSTTKVPLRDSEGRVVGLAGISRDIGDRKLAEEELERALATLRLERAELLSALQRLNQANEELSATREKLSHITRLHSVGALAAGVVHEIKNPLAVMSVGLEYLSSQLSPQNGEVALAIKNMRSACDVANRVAHGLLDFCRPGKIDACASSIEIPIERAMLLMHFAIIKHKVTVDMRVPADLPKVDIDCTHIEQVFVNLIANALHAMPTGGALTITAKAGEWKKEEENAPRENEPVVIVTVEDTGAGIPKDKLASVFEPFFSTKAAGEGTGLGLPIARSIMELHGGAIFMDNVPGSGARATLIFKTSRGLTKS